MCGVDAHETIQLQTTLKRSKLLAFFANRPAALVAMEAGSGAHHWARELGKLGHDARIIDPRLVVPYRQQGRTGKNDMNDAAAVCEATARPRMRFVPIKSEQQQAVLVVHRLRAASLAEHTRTINRMRGLLGEFGVVAPKGASTFKERWVQLRLSKADSVPALAWQTLDDTWYEQLLALHQKVLAYDRQIKQFVDSNRRSENLVSLRAFESRRTNEVWTRVCHQGAWNTHHNRSRI